MTEGGSPGVQVIARAAEILRVIQDAPGGLTQSDISAKLGLARTTVHRILSAMEDEGWIAVPGARGRYRLGPALRAMAQSARGATIEVIRPHLVLLSRLLNETVDLSALDGDHITFVDQVVAPRTLRAVSAVGVALPVHCSAPGKAVLAALPEHEADWLITRKLTRFTSHTITDPGDLERELSKVRRAGFAVDREEHHDGISAVGCVLGEPWGDMLALSVPVPTSRFRGREKDIAHEMLRTREGIVAELWPGTEPGN